MAAQALDSTDGVDVDDRTIGQTQDDALPGRRTRGGRLRLPSPTDAIIRAEGLGWSSLIGILIGMIREYLAQLVVTFMLGIARVAAFIGVGVVSALVVLAVKNGESFEGLLIILGITAPLAGIFHWIESWFAHDMAYRLLAGHADRHVPEARCARSGLPDAAAQRRSGGCRNPTMSSSSNISSPTPSRRRSSPCSSPPSCLRPSSRSGGRSPWPCCPSSSTPASVRCSAEAGSIVWAHAPARPPAT